MNILGRNLDERLMKAMDLWYTTLPELRPAAVALQEDMPGSSPGPGAIPVLKLI